MTKTSIISIVAVLGALAISGAAKAEDSAPQLKIDAYGYDLSTEAGVAALNTKAHLAINTVCAQGFGAGLDDMATVNSCKTREYAKAEAWIHQLRDRQVQLAQATTTAPAR
jgi:UrcA family protein